MATSPEQNNDRAFYRLRYPEPERPTLVVDGERYLVSELSEGGMRVMSVNLDRAVQGILMLKDGTRLKIKAIVGRIVDGESVLMELSGVSFGVLMSEQRRLLKRYLVI